MCFRAAEGQAGAATQREAADLVSVDGGPATESRLDEYGYTWLTVRAAPGDTASLVTDLHAVNSALEAQGFGTGLLCVQMSSQETVAKGTSNARQLAFHRKKQRYVIQWLVGEFTQLLQ